MADILIIALKQRCFEEGLELNRENLANQFRLHLHRGIGYLYGDQSIKKIEDFVEISIRSLKN